jgi:hypothetical protein
MLSRPLSFVLVVVGAFPLGAGDDQTLAGSFLRIEDHRVATVGYRIATGAVAYCPDRIPVSGLYLDHLAEYAAADRPGLILRRSLDRGPGVLSVVDNSPAARAGLIAGDVLLSINERSVSSSPQLLTSPEAARDLTGRLLEQALRLGSARLLVLRSGREVPLLLAAQPGCPARVRLARSEEARAAAGGGKIVLTTAALAETQSDDELAVIIGHELAHVVLKHGERLRAQRVPRGWLREFGRNAERVLETEKEADRLGIKLAWAAGYDANAAIPFWRRFYAKYDGPRLFRTHPALPQRERLIRATIAELEAGAERPELGKGAPGQR